MRINLFIISLLLFSSCTKTNTLPYEEESKAKIKSFQVTNSADHIPVSINHQNGIITATVPPGIYLTAIEPKIELEDGNKLKSGSDTLITNLQDYFINGRKIEYPITHKNGEKKTYVLEIKTHQPPLNFREVSLDPNSPIVFDQSKSHITKMLYVRNLSGNYPYSTNYDLDQTLAKASLVDDKGKEYKFTVAMSSISTIITPSQIILNLNQIEGRFDDKGYHQIPSAGLYWVKIRYYDREEKLKNPIKITY
ncbi:hypothetical protein ACFQ2C_11900 [Sphingobacterium daejeonense]|uniref:Uncharacterized protein n=1 Tax=Sphingobacterium daejeonense TaxID=371142 RepID=A0ABW3RM89_9SPHI